VRQRLVKESNKHGIASEIAKAVSLFRADEQRRRGTEARTLPRQGAHPLLVSLARERTSASYSSGEEAVARRGRRRGKSGKLFCPQRLSFSSCRVPKGSRFYNEINRSTRPSVHREPFISAACIFLLVSAGNGDALSCRASTRRTRLRNRVDPMRSADRIDSTALDHW